MRQCFFAAIMAERVALHIWYNSFMGCPMITHILFKRILKVINIATLSTLYVYHVGFGVTLAGLGGRVT